jgi:hypothetical protein
VFLCRKGDAGASSDGMEKSKRPDPGGSGL